MRMAISGLIGQHLPGAETATCSRSRTDTTSAIGIPLGAARRVRRAVRDGDDAHNRARPHPKGARRNLMGAIIALSPEKFDATYPTAARRRYPDRRARGRGRRFDALVSERAPSTRGCRRASITSARSGQGFRCQVRRRLDDQIAARRGSSRSLAAAVLTSIRAPARQAEIWPSRMARAIASCRFVAPNFDRIESK
jgi:hypothetical protein